MKHIQWNDIPEATPNDEFMRKIAWDGKWMIGRTDAEQGYVFPPHSHDNQKMTFVVSGKGRFRLEGRTVDVGPNEMIFFPPMSSTRQKRLRRWSHMTFSRRRANTG